MIDQDKKIRLLVLADSPTSATGFAQVSRNILNRLAKSGKYAIDVIGINYHGDYYDREKFPYAIYPAMPQGWADMYGRDRLMTALGGNQEKYGLIPGWDIVFTIQDPFVIEGLGLNYPFAEQLKVSEAMWKRMLEPELWFKWVAYWPVDANLKENWVTKAMALPDVNVAYCEWGRDQILKWDREDGFVTKFNIASKEGSAKVPAAFTTPSLKDRIDVIHHGVDLDVFKPLDEKEIKKFRKQYFGDAIKDDTFLVINVSRNQPRKDLARTLAAFAKFKEQVPNSHLYLHCQGNDAGGSIEEMAHNFGLVIGNDYSLPRDFSANAGFPVEQVNQIYNAADLCISTTLGEGWGFITTEAMATKTPICAPNITSIINIFGTNGIECDVAQLDKGLEVRGIPIKAGSTNSEWICMGQDDNERIRPLTNVDDMVDKMLWAYKNPNKVQTIVDRAYEWVQELSWDKIADQWEAIFERVYTDLQRERALGAAIDKTNRNDPCPCGSGLKFKKCHGSEQKVDRFADWTEAAKEQVHV